MTMPSHSLFGAPYDNSMQARMALQANINNQKQILGVHANNLAAMQSGTASMLDGMYTHMPTLPLAASRLYNTSLSYIMNFIDINHQQLLFTTRPGI